METFGDYREKAIKALQANFAHIKTHKHEQRVDKYIAVAKKEILRYWIDMEVKGNLANVRINEIHRNAGRYQLRKGSKEQTYISKWLDKNCALYAVCELGSNLSGNLTQIKLNYDLGITAEIVYATVNADEEISDEERREMLMMLYGDGFEALDKHTDNNKTVDMTEIDLKSLKAYIDKTQYTYNNNKNNYSDKLLQRVKQAKRIYAIAKLLDGNLIQVINESDFGRKYYRGANLQSVHKDVRHAALGDCIEFDIANSVYAWRYDLVKDIEPGAKYTATLDYLQFKKTYREKLAEIVFGDVEVMGDDAKINIIKEAFTALSFGAKGTTEEVGWYVNGNYKTLALNTIITANERRKRFLNDSFVADFIKEQEEISNIIYRAIKDELKETEYFKNNKIKQSTALAYLYQHAERDVMDRCLAHIQEDKLLLVVHDAFYVKRISADELIDVKQELEKTNGELKLERKEHKRYTAFDDVGAEHKAFIQEEEIKAKKYAEKNNKH